MHLIQGFWNHLLSQNNEVAESLSEWSSDETNNSSNRNEFPFICRQVDLEDSLGVNADIFSMSFNKRKEQIEAGLRPSWRPDEHCFYRKLEDRSPSPARR